MSPVHTEVIPLLDLYDPLGDLMARMGKAPDPYTGISGKAPEMGKDCKFAIISRIPTPGLQYYPIPYYASIFDDAWYDIYRLIGIGKRYMIKNTSAPRIQIEVHRDYWEELCNNEDIIDPDKRKERILLEEIVKVFDYDRIYSEREVNLRIADFYDDFCTLRRDMIAEKLMDRDTRGYWRVKP